MTSTPLSSRPPGVLIAGGGLAAQRAAETLRRSGYDGPVRVIAGEAQEPYDRPPLSKEFLAGDVDETALRLRPDAWYADHAVELLLGERAAALDAAARTVTLESGGRLRYAQLLIATGCVPRRLPGSERFDNVHELRTLADARALRDALRPGARVVIVGAGFIGQEVAATAHRLGAEVTIVEAAASPLAAVLGEELGGWFTQLHREEGIEVLVSAQIARLHGDWGVQAVELQDGRRLDCDLMVVGIGTEPATAWLAGSGLDDGGIRVDAAGRSAAPGVFAAGDACRSFDVALGTHVRTEHWEAAGRQGAAAARAMLGLAPAPPAVASFWSDQHGVRIQYLGHAHRADAMRIDGDPAARDFTATFTHQDRPVAALIVGRPQALPDLRRRIHAATHPHDERTPA